MSALGYGTVLPPLTSATVYSTASPHFGKFTKMRPLFATVTPVGMAPAKVATTSSLPMTCSSASFWPTHIAEHASRKTQIEVDLIAFFSMQPPSSLPPQGSAAYFAIMPRHGLLPALREYASCNSLLHLGHGVSRPHVSAVSGTIFRSGISS